jgi:hypothetical protein
MNQKKLEKQEKFFQENSELKQKLKVSQLLKSDYLTGYTKRKIANKFEKYLEENDHPFNEEIPLEYLIGDIIVGYYSLHPAIHVKIDIENCHGHVIFASATGEGKSNSVNFLLDTIQKMRFDD